MVWILLTSEVENQEDKDGLGTVILTSEVINQED